MLPMLDFFAIDWFIFCSRVCHWNKWCRTGANTAMSGGALKTHATRTETLTVVIEEVYFTPFLILWKDGAYPPPAAAAEGAPPMAMAALNIEYPQRIFVFLNFPVSTLISSMIRCSTPDTRLRILCKITPKSKLCAWLGFLRAPELHPPWKPPLRPAENFTTTRISQYFNESFTSDKVRPSNRLLTLLSFSAR